MSQSRKVDTEVLIVGAGPTGLTMACELRRRGIDCRVIDKAEAPAQTSRALAVHSRTLEVFDDVGIAEPLLKQGVRITGANVYEGQNQLLHLRFRQMDPPFPSAERDNGVPLDEDNGGAGCDGDEEVGPAEGRQ